jgi:hypothetical protein
MNVMCDTKDLLLGQPSTAVSSESFSVLIKVINRDRSPAGPIRVGLESREGGSVNCVCVRALACVRWSI